MSFSPHFCTGHIPTAFVFSAPGKKEKDAGRPVVGATGENLELALTHLKAAEPRCFPSLDRYDYRITNAIQRPIARALGDRASEAGNAEIRALSNVERVLQELEGCRLVVLSGHKARLLAEPVRRSGRAVVEVPHAGNRGLLTFRTDGGEQASSGDRRRDRVRHWANAVLRQVERLGCPD